MKRSLLTSFVFLFSILLTFAAPVDEQSARKSANDFLRSKLPVTRSSNIQLTRAITGIADGNDAAVYVFNADNMFVIVSGDDSAPAILGYSDNGAFDKDNAPDGLKAMLGWYQYAVSKSQSVTRGAVSSHEAIKPLLKTKWNQSGPYNLLCPYDSDAKATSVTGCVATAAAQVMNYYQWPDTYEWDKMKNEYEKNDSTDAGYAVAKLMKDVGEAVFMNYSANGSGANSVYACEALRNNFSYAYSTEVAERENYTSEEWDELIYSNLSAGKPVYYSGDMIDLSNDTGKWKGARAGHAFVVDGYDSDGLYHINWGWGGTSNGYFLLSVLNPDNQGIGGASGAGGYSIDQMAIVNIAKSATPNTTDFRLYTVDPQIDGGKTEFSRSNTSEDFPGFALYTGFVNYLQPLKDRKFDLGFALYQGDKMLSVLYSVTDSIKAGEGWYYESDPIKIGKDLSDGTYQIRPICRETGKEDWVLCLYAYDSYYQVNISGTKLTITIHGANNSSVSMFGVNSKEVSTDNQVGRPITFKLNLTDKNILSNSPIFLWGNEDVDDCVLLTGIGTNLNSGETGDVILQYVPQREGDYKFYLSGSNKNCVAIDSFEVSVAAAAQFDLVVNTAYEITGADENRNVPGTTLGGNIKVTNNSTDVYYGPVFIRLYKNQAGSSTYSSIDNTSVTTEIAVGKTADVPFKFEDLETDIRYALLVYMKEKGEWKWVNSYDKDGKSYISSESIFYLTSDTGLNSVLQDDPDADVYDMRGVRIGKASELNNLPKGLYIIKGKKVLR